MFKRTFQLLVVVCVAASALWSADPSFVGDWKINPSKSKLTDEMKVASVGANEYAFDFGSGHAEKIVANGTDQPGNSGTTLSVTVGGRDKWTVVRKKNGHMLLTAAWKLSEDGQTLRDAYTEFRPDGSASTVNYIYTRTAGTSGFAGSWESTFDATSGYVLQVRAYEKDGLSFIDPSRKQTRSMKFDGKDYSTAGPNEAPGATSAIRRINEDTLEMTAKINGKVTKTEEITLSADLKTLTVTVHGMGGSKPDILVFERQ